MSTSKLSPSLQALAEIEKLVLNQESIFYSRGIVERLIADEVVKTQDKFGVPEAYIESKLIVTSVRKNLVAKFPHLDEQLNMLPLLDKDHWDEEHLLKSAMVEYRNHKPFEYTNGLSSGLHTGRFMEEIAYIDAIINEKPRHTEMNYGRRLSNLLRRQEENQTQAAKDKFKRGDYVQKAADGKGYTLTETFLYSMTDVVCIGLDIRIKNAGDNCFELSVEGKVLTWYDTLREAIMSAEDRLKRNEASVITDVFSKARKGLPWGEDANHRGFTKSTFEVLIGAKDLVIPGEVAFSVVSGGWKEFEVVEEGLELDNPKCAVGISYEQAEAFCKHLRSSLSNSKEVSKLQRRVADMRAALAQTEADLAKAQADSLAISQVNTLYEDNNFLITNGVYSKLTRGIMNMDGTVERFDGEY
tara:strand:+ start:2639 stop:3880 length:1242 start_codon:yes stop_codon:yes gene_type:complete